MNDKVDKHDALYARYSSHQQDDSTSIEVQLEQCERAAGGSLVHYIDRARTGRTAGGRPALHRLLDNAESGLIRRLYVYKYDRLGRNAGTHVLIEDLEEMGVEVISVTEGNNCLARGVQLVVASEYSRGLAERTREGLVKRFEAGCWTGGPAPYGYQRVVAADRSHRLAKNPTEVTVIETLAKEYLAESIGFKELAHRLEHRGIPTRQGKAWSFTTVRQILTNRMLIGEISYGRREFKLNRQTGRRRPKFNEQSKQMVRREEDFRILTDAQFEQIQQKIAKSRTHRQVPRSPKVIRPLTRHLFCGQCGTVYHSRKSENTKGQYRYYGCGQRATKGPAACPNSVSVREDLLIEKLMKSIEGVFTPGTLLAEATKRAEEMLGVYRSETQRLTRELSGVDKLINSLTQHVASAQSEPAAQKAFYRQIGEAEGTREKLIKALNVVQTEVQKDAEEVAGECRVVFEEAKTSFATMTTSAELNRFIEVTVGPMVVMGKDLIVA